ncbi:uncharacterized protein [Magallana gigas]|uniref:uncharacterized protein n=1 Tax=Magallana gigas TaxID=29159 RepID=UPI003340CC46
MFGFNKPFPLFTREKMADIACQMMTELGQTCGMGFLPTVVLSASTIALLTKGPAVMRFITETWRQEEEEEEGNPLHRCVSRESLSPTPSGESLPSPKLSSCVDGGRGSDLAPTSSTPL